LPQLFSNLDAPDFCLLSKYYSLSVPISIPFIALVTWLRGLYNDVITEFQWDYYFSLSEHYVVFFKKDARWLPF
jgi:hypothetical protein